MIYTRHHARKGFDRFEEDVDAYNQVATKIITDAGIPIDNLNQVIHDNDPATCIGEDGVHMTDKGNQALATQVAKYLKQYL